MIGLFDTDIDTPAHERAHRTDPDTSQDAAARVTHAEELKNAIVRILREGIPGAISPHGLAAFEVQDFYTRQREFYGWPLVQPHSIPRRMSELHNDGRIRDTEHRVPTPFGRNAVVWAVA